MPLLHIVNSNTIPLCSKTRTFASLSKGAFDVLKGDALFNLFRHAFLEIGVDVEGEQLGEFDEQPVAEYANTLVIDLFKLNQTQIETEATLILNVWMYVAHQLYEVIRACKRNDATSTADMNRGLDIAAALWIGTGQERGDNGSGNMLYNLAENAGQRFDQDRGETEANTLFVDALDALRIGVNLGTCANSDEDGYVEFRTIVRKMFGYMTIPLLQNLIHHIAQEPSLLQKDFVELYTLAIAPRVEACNPSAYKEMLQLFVNQDFDVSVREDAIRLIHEVHPCFEVTCAQIGSYRSGEYAACSDEPTVPVFAAYPATTSNATPVRFVCTDSQVLFSCG